MSHTPGPWYWIDAATQDAGEGVVICNVPAPGAGKSEIVAVIPSLEDKQIGDREFADAALLAAAPDLLNACEGAEALVSLLSTSDPGTSDYRDVLTPNDIVECVLMLRRAIAKAKEESK